MGQRGLPRRLLLLLLRRSADVSCLMGLLLLSHGTTAPVSWDYCSCLMGLKLLLRLRLRLLGLRLRLRLLLLLRRSADFNLSRVTT